MFTLTYWNQSTAVIDENGKYIHHFKSLEEVRAAVASANQIAVTYQPGTRTEIIDLTPAVKHLLKIIPPVSFSVD